jgi:phosphate transport system substrate-binding protein
MNNIQFIGDNMKSFHLVCTLFIVTTLVLTACGSPATQTPHAALSQTTLTVAGSGGAATVLKYLAEAYSQQHSEVSFEFLSGSSSGGGVKGVLDSTLDLGTLSRPPKDSELASGIEYITISIDRIVIAASSDLSISGLTSQQVKDIFLGDITNWSAVGGPDVSINVFVRDEEESSTQVLRKELFGDEDFAAGSVVFTSDGELRTALSDAANTITFLGYSGIRLSDANIHTLAIDGKDPADLSSDYPYTRPMGIAYLPSNAAKVQPFLDFISSPEAFALLAEKGINPPE